MMFPSPGPAKPSRESPPILVVVVDTEEEFAWGAGFRRDAIGVTAMMRIGAFQEICDEFGIRPHYAIDYPIASQPEGFTQLRRFRDEGRCEIGAHLHPWVNPPHEEDVSDWNSYAGNLPPALERAKIIALTDAIEVNLGVRPVAFKAGRYGLGASTARTLEELGYEIDLSVCPRIDLRATGGPDFRTYSAAPFWFGESRRLLEVPVTAEFVGFLRHIHPVLSPLLETRLARLFRLRGLISRLGAFERLRLSPEGMSHDQHRRIVRSLVRRGVRTLTFSFHSTSLAPGHTAYVPDERALEEFLGSCRRFFKFFLDELRGVAMTPFELRDRLERER